MSERTVVSRRAEGRQWPPGHRHDDGVCVIVPHQDSAALAAAIRLVLTRPAAGPSTPPTLRWPAVAERYEDLAHRLIYARSTTIDVK
ncbi:hypothetical protein GCM10009557_23140 [Virgisporangium ochraceum]|uniref:Uncharacterized protein n=1 Tax=Virgisporangium ochraceum TaxID=65505 RepID=A0A8J4EK82_9ACTN|nr:hypothetical protein [Virgisporangium ochraceum]GIJ75117.1 hypothetical protein Voc01_100340 [Virgisporangium ochraceum]